MGWRQQIDQAQEQLFALDRDLKQLGDLLWEFRNDSSQFNLPDPVKGFISGCIGELDQAVGEARGLFDTLFLPVVEPEIAHDFLDYLKKVHAGHQSFVERFDPVTTRFLEYYQPPDKHAQYQQSLPQARADMLETDTLLAAQIKNLDALIQTSENLTALLIALLAAVLIFAVAVGSLVATALLDAPISGPTMVVSVGEGVGTAEGASAAAATAGMELGEVVGVEVPSLAWVLEAGVALTLATIGTAVAERTQPDINVLPNPGQQPGPPDIWKILLLAALISLPLALGILAYIMLSSQGNNNNQPDIVYPPGITTDEEKRRYRELLAKYGDTLLAAELAKAGLDPAQADELASIYGLDAIRKIAHDPNLGGSSTLANMWQARHISGITKVVAALLADQKNASGIQGDLYELEWMAHHSDQVTEVALTVTGSDGKPKKGPDALTKDGKLIQLKAYKWNNGYVDTLNIKNMQEQLAVTRQRFPNEPVIFVLDPRNGQLTESDIASLEARGIYPPGTPGVSVTWEYWP